MIQNVDERQSPPSSPRRSRLSSDRSEGFRRRQLGTRNHGGSAAAEIETIVPPVGRVTSQGMIFKGWPEKEAESLTMSAINVRNPGAEGAAAVIEKEHTPLPSRLSRKGQGVRLSRIDAPPPGYHSCS